MAPQVVQYPRATSSTAHSSHATGVEGARGPGYGARGRWRGLAGLRDGASPPSTAGAAGVEGAGGSGGRKRGLAAVPVGGGGARPGFEPTHRTMHQHRRRRRCGGRRRVRRARACFEIDHSERNSRVAISRAAGPDGARNTSGAASNKLNREFRLRRRCGGRRGACRAWPGFETTRRAKLAARTASGRAGPAAAVDQARLQAPLEIRTPRSTPGSGRPGGRRGARAR